MVGAVPAINEIVVAEFPIIFLKVTAPVRPFDCTPSILPANSPGVQFLVGSTSRLVATE